MRNFEEIKTYKGNLFLVKPENLIFSKINVRHGCIYYHDQHFEFVVSSEYPAFTLDKNKVNGLFLTIILRTEYFKNYLKSRATGHSKARVNVNDFTSMQIPLPPLSIQNQLVSDYQNRLKQADEAESKASELEKGIESYLLAELGIEIKSEQQKKKGLQFVKFSEACRWDFDYLINQHIGIFSALNQAKYPSIKLGKVYNFINRSWSKHKHKEKIFRYIEIGSVDAFLGITYFSEIETQNAPSRATQIIKTNDLILGLTRPYLKKFSLVSEKYDNYVCSSGFQVIAPSENYSLEFLLEFLKSEAGVKQFEFFMTGGLYPAITTAQLRDLEIPLPPLSVQNAIVSHISRHKEEIRQLKAEAEKLRAEAKEEFEKEVFQS